MKVLVLATCLLGVLPRVGTAESLPTRERTLPSLVRGSARIFVGTVRRLQYRPDTRSGMIATYATFGEVTLLRGAFPSPGRREIRLRVAGGRDTDGSWVRIEGIPRFRVGERYLIFQEAGDPVFCTVTGWDQGCYRLARRPGRADRIVLGADGVPVLGVREGRVQRGRPVSHREQQSLFGATIPRGIGVVPVSAAPMSDDRSADAVWHDTGGSAAARLVVTRTTVAAPAGTVPLFDPTEFARAIPAARFLAEVRRELVR